MINVVNGGQGFDNLLVSFELLQLLAVYGKGHGIHAKAGTVVGSI